MTNTPHWTAQPSPSTGKPTHSDDAHKEDSLDEALEEFFPASDPPAVGTST